MAITEFYVIVAVVVTLDSFQCIPFAYFEYKKAWPIKFAAIKLLSLSLVAYLGVGVVVLHVIVIHNDQRAAILPSHDYDDLPSGKMRISLSICFGVKNVASIGIDAGKELASWS